MTLELDLLYSKTKSYAKFQLNISKHVKEMTLELDLLYSKTKSYAKFQLNMSKHVKEKCGKLCISSILSSKKGITPTKIALELDL